MVLKTRPFDATEHLGTPEAQAAYLAAMIEAAQEDRDPRLITIALGDIARARGMSAIAEEAGVTRAALYRALSEGGDPRLSTFLGVLRALGVEITAKAS